MQRLVIKNVGPVREADIWLKKVNVFIGPQSSGKSTIAKIISFCSWLEKNKHETEGSYLFATPVIDKMVSYHRMEGYLSEDSRIFYQGENLAFAYNWKKDEDFPVDFDSSQYNVTHNNEAETFFFNTERRINPKVLYIPADRNFVSAVPNLRKYDDSKDSLQSFVVDWFEAKSSYKRNTALDLIDLGMRYFSEDGIDYVQMDDGKSLRLRNASSGLQSITPLLVLTDYMTKGMYEKERPFSVEEQEELNNVLHKLVKESIPSGDAADLKRRLLGFLQGKVYTHTQFVIEEPEQNLFPTEQYKLMEYLAAIINHGKSHRLTLSTHSPYIINYLNVLLRRPENSASYLNKDTLNVYLISDGGLNNLMMHDEREMKWAVDTSVLNAAMKDIVDEFCSLAR